MCIICKDAPVPASGTEAEDRPDAGILIVPIASSQSRRRPVKTILAALTIAALALPAASIAQPTATLATACTRDVSATIGGEHKCLGAGEYCKIYDARQYLRYGFRCSGSPARLHRI
jgi:hypothetical protein